MVGSLVAMEATKHSSS